VRTAEVLRDARHYAALSYTFDSMVIDMSRYLAYLESRFTAGRSERLIVSQHVADLEGITGYDVVVNCAGLGARDLTGGDELIQARRGQIVRVKRADFPDLEVGGERISALLDGDQEAVGAGALTYLVARFGDIVLGGTYELLNREAERRHMRQVEQDAGGAWSVAVRQGIFNRCAGLLEALGAGGALTTDLRRYAAMSDLPAEAVDDGGLRPFREPIRVERGDDLSGGARLIHNYGHGGAGVTLSWGCARRVRELL
jgi:D-amino-acid oxidase